MKLRCAKYYGKKLAENSPIIIMPSPDYVKIPLGQGQCVPATLCVKVDDEVKIGTLIGQGKKSLFSTNVHSSICGTICDIAIDKREDGSSCDFVLIRANGKTDTDYLKPQNNPTDEEIKQRMFDAGIIGQGGAGFPTHIKCSANDCNIKTVIINGCECDDYLASDYRVMIERSEQVIKGAEYIRKCTNAEHVIISVMKRNKLAAQVLKQNISELKQNNIEVRIVKNLYPAGNERALVFTITGLTYDLDKRPDSVGVLVNNVQTAAAVFNAVELGKPSVSRVLTVSGVAIKNPGVYEVPVGTSYVDLVAFCGGEKYPVNEFADIEVKAFDTYGEYVEMKDELKNNKTDLELKEAVKLKGREANCLVIEYLKLVKKVSPILLNCLIYGGYETGIEQRDMNYVVSKNSLGVLLLSRKENARRNKKYQ